MKGGALGQECIAQGVVRQWVAVLLASDCLKSWSSQLVTPPCCVEQSDDMACASTCGVGHLVCTFSSLFLDSTCLDAP